MNDWELIKGSGKIYEIESISQLGFNRYEYNTKDELKIVHQEIDQDLQTDKYNDFTTIEIHQWRHRRTYYWQYEISHGADRTQHSQYFETFIEAQETAFRHVAELHSQELQENLISEIKRRAA